MIRLSKHSTLPALALACVGLAACGGTKTADIPNGSDTSQHSASIDTSTTTTTATKPPSFAAPTAEVKKLATAAGTNTKAEPKIPKPSGSPPKKLTVVDIVPGSGAAAKPGDTLNVDYAGYSWSNGKLFDASWKRHQTFPVTLGQNQVIQGWEQGLQGMKQGGRRMIVIPPSLGYGPSGSGPIKPNETLIFVVDLRKKT